MKASEDKDVVGNFVVELRGLKKKWFFYRQLPLDEYNNNFDKNWMISIKREH